MDSQILKTQLLQTDQEFRALSTAHQELDERLAQLTAIAHPSEGEQLEEVELKKRKHQLKDRMEDILRRHRALPA